MENSMEVLKNKLKRGLPRDPESPLLGIYSEKTKTLILEDTWTPIFKAALFTTAKIRKQHKCSSTDAWIKEMLHSIYTMECCEVKAVQLCPTLWDPMDYTVHRILQARTLEWVAFPFSRASSQPRDWTQVSCIAGGFYTIWAIREALQWNVI